MRPVISAVVACSLLLPIPALAADGMLAPGKPAGIRTASSENKEAVLLAAVAGLGLAGGIFLIFFHKKGTSSSVSSTGTP